MKNYLLFVILSLCTLTALSQSDTIWSNRIYSNQHHFYSTAIAPMTEKSSLIVGHTSSRGLVIRVDSLGVPILFKEITPSGGGGGHLYCTVAASDTTMLVGGRMKNPVSNAYDAFIAKLDSVGDTLWTRTYSNESVSISMADIVVASDGGYLAVVVVDNYTDIGLMKLDADGTIVWVKVIESEDETWYRSITAASDGTFFLITRKPYVGEDVVSRFDQLGGLIWSKEFGNSGLSESYAGFANSVFIQGLEPSTGKVALFKLDYDGTMDWARKYETFPAGDQEELQRMIVNDNGTFGMLYGDGYQSLFMLMDTMGTNMEVYVPDVEAIDFLYRDSNWIIVGNGPTYGIKNADIDDPSIGIMKVDTAIFAANNCFRPHLSVVSSDITTFVGIDQALTISTPAFVRSYYELTYENTESYIIEEGCVYREGSVQELNRYGLEVFPTLTSGKINLKTASQEPFLYAVVNPAGQQVNQGSTRSGAVEIDLSGHETGIYFYTVSFGDGSFMNGKIVLIN